MDSREDRIAVLKIDEACQPLPLDQRCEVRRRRRAGAIVPTGIATDATLAKDVLRQDPFSGHLFVFRGRGGDLIKVLWWDGQGLCLFAKRLERGRFVWPSPADGRVVITPAQLAMLLEGQRGRPPSLGYHPARS
jgi:transposase